MKGDNILLTRIDNRLVHGQVGVTWTQTLNANLIVVADDVVAEDELQKSLMTVTAKSSNVGIRFFTIQKTADVIEKDLNVGNMHFAPGKRELSKKVYVDDTDMDDLKFIVSTGTNVFIQDVPGTQKEMIK